MGRDPVNNGSQSASGLYIPPAPAARPWSARDARPGYLIQVEDGELDAQRFEGLLAQGKHTLTTGDPGHAAALLRRALALWRGPALADVMYEPFAQAEAGRLEELRLSCLEERIEADLALGRHADLVGELEVLTGGHPYREHLIGRLMLALYRSGRQAEALEVYRQSRSRLSMSLALSLVRTFARSQVGYSTKIRAWTG